MKISALNVSVPETIFAVKPFDLSGKWSRPGYSITFLTVALVNSNERNEEKSRGLLMTVSKLEISPPELSGDVNPKNISSCKPYENHSVFWSDFTGGGTATTPGGKSEDCKAASTNSGTGVGVNVIVGVKVDVGEGVNVGVCVNVGNGVGVGGNIADSTVQLQDVNKITQMTMINSG